MTKNIVIDTNVFGDMFSVFHEVRKVTPEKSYEELWNVIDYDFVEKSGARLDLKKHERAFVAIKRLQDLWKSSNRDQYKILIPKYVYNEAVLGKTSKINREKGGVNRLGEETLSFMESIPLEKNIDKTELHENDFPEKTLDKTKIDENMDTFLNRQQNQNFQNLVEYLRTRDEKAISDTETRINKMKQVSTDVHEKFQNWDKTIQLNFNSYKSKADLLDGLYGKMKDYKKVEKVASDPEALKSISNRLTRKNEEFDFFDLQIYLFAKEHNAAIFTSNTEAFQEINDPCFLGYFDKVEIAHPLINFELPADLENLGDCHDVMKSSILSDFEKDKEFLAKQKLQNYENDPTRGELDLSLVESNIKNSIDNIISKYQEGFLVDVLKENPLINALKTLKFLDGKIYVSKKDMFSSFGPKDEDRTLATLKLVDAQFFDGQLAESNFRHDVEEKDPKTNKKYKMPYLKDPQVAHMLNNFLNVGEGKNIENFLNVFKSIETSKEDKKAFITALYIESHASRDEIKNMHSNFKQPVSRTNVKKECLKGSKRRRREAQACFASWEDVDRFNDETDEKRNIDKVKINSDKFLDYINSIENPQLRDQLIQLVDQLASTSNEERITGNSAPELRAMYTKNRIIEHFSRVGQGSQVLNEGMFAKNILADFLKGDVKGMAINLGFIAGGNFLSKVADAALIKGAEMLSSGKLFLGNAFKLGSPFIARLASGFIVYDLIKEIGELNKNHKEAIVNIVADGTYLVIDSVEIGVTMMESLGFIEGVSAVTGPIGIAIGAVVFIGTDIYFAVKQVEKIDADLHLNTNEKILLGLRSFFQIPPPHYIEKLEETKSANNRFTSNAVQFLKDNQHIQRYVFPSATYNELSEEVELAKDSEIMPSSTYNIKWSRARPNNVDGANIFCAPQGDFESVSNTIVYKCVNAIGIEDLTPKPEKSTLYNLGDGDDVIIGFKDSPNIFFLGSGRKHVTGGDKDDVFILDKGVGGSRLGKPLTGTFNGLGGTNTLDFSKISEFLKVSTFIDGSNGVTLSIRSAPGIRFSNINAFIGRKDVGDNIYANHNIRYINSQGGKRTQQDHIYIMNSKCQFNTKIFLSSNTFVTNKATRGDFLYFVDSVSLSGMSLVLGVSYKENQSQMDPDDAATCSNTSTNTDVIKHVFFLNCELFDLGSITFSQTRIKNTKNVQVYFYFHGNENYNLYTTINNIQNNPTTFNLKDGTQIKFQNNGLYIMHKTDQSIDDIIRKYPTLAQKLNSNIIVYSTVDNSIVTIGTYNHDVLSNSPEYITHIIGADGSNMYSIYPPFKEGLSQFPDTIIYSNREQTDINTLDLRGVSRQIQKEKGAKLLIAHTIENKKLFIRLYVTGSRFSSSKYFHLSTVTFTDIQGGEINWTTWCKKLHVIFNNAPVELNCDEKHHHDDFFFITKSDVYDPTYYYTPVPLTFDNTYEVIVITVEDVEPNSEIRVPQQAGQYKFLRYNNDLIITNGFDSKIKAAYPCSVMFKHFYDNSELFNTLSVKFTDVVVYLNKAKSDIEDAEFCEDYIDMFFGNMSVNHEHHQIRRDTKYLPHDLLNVIRPYDIELPTDELEPVSSGSSRGFSIINSGFQIIGQLIYPVMQYCAEPIKQLSNRLTTFSTAKRYVYNNIIDRGYSLQQKFDSGNRWNVSKISHSGSGGDTINHFIHQHLPDVNGTLGLLDLLVRKYNDEKYHCDLGIPLSRENNIEKQCASIITHLGYDKDQVSSSIDQKFEEVLKKFYM